MPKNYKSYAGAGVDVAEQRADDLDKVCLNFLADKERPEVLDLGCGAGGQSFRMAQAGAVVTAVDSYDFHEQFSRQAENQTLSSEKVAFSQLDILEYVTTTQSTFDAVLFQRTLHYFTYEQAVFILKKLHNITKDALFVSVTGLDSAVGAEYPAKTQPIADRFCMLSVVGAETFSIHKPVCLYTKTEFQRLLTECGWQVDTIWESAFGNIKAVCKV